MHPSRTPAGGTRRAVALSSVVALAALTAGEAYAGVARGTVEHTVRVKTLERTGRPVERTREEVWIGIDRARMVTIDPQGALVAELLYEPGGTWSFRPSRGLTRMPTMVELGGGVGIQQLDETSTGQCALQHPGTRRIGTTRRFGRSADIVRWRFGGQTTTCVIDGTTRALLESRDVVRRYGRTRVTTMRVVSTETVPQQPGMLELSPAAAALVGQAQPVPPVAAG